MKFAYASTLAFVLAASLAGAAAAETVTSDTLKDVNGSSGPVTATTTTDANGRATTVTGPDGGAFRYSDPSAPKDTWQQQNVGAGGTVGITKDFARSGNGSALFEGTGSGSKADLEIYFSSAVALSSLTSLSYDAIRDSSSTVFPHLINSLRLMIGDANGVFTNTYLIFEPVYNGYPTASPIAEDTWYTFNISGSTTVFANNGNLVEPAGAGPCSGCYATLSAWQAANATATIVGLSTGSGSGWNGGTYRGAVDNISFTAGAETKSYNFEVAAVPEPASWALMIGGFGLAGAMVRRRRAALA